jgi:DNA polymerase-3 subunit alpha
MDIAAARIHFGRQFAFSFSGKMDPAQIKNALSAYRSPTGLPLTMRYTQHGIGCEIRWPDEWRVTPADALRQSLVEGFGVQQALVEY